MSARASWRQRRAEMESTKGRHSIAGRRGQGVLRALRGTIKLILAAIGLARRGRANALAPELTRMDVPCADLPAAFEGFTILHLSDFHLESLPELAPLLVAALRGIRADLAVLTGDYQQYDEGSPQGAAALLRPIVAAIHAEYGIFGILGNHDSWQMVPELEAMGVQVLVNEHAAIEHGGEFLVLAGLDDVHAFHSPAAEAALTGGPGGPRIALVHTPDMATAAARAGVMLYLTGHTHGGQICLPGRRPLATALDTHHHLASGLWRVGAMAGYTSRGLGTGSVLARFNCPPEIALLRLVRAS